jgi:kelch-like protein 8
MPYGNSNHAACAVGRFIFVFGGAEDEGSLDSVFKYDTETNIWTTLAPMPRAGSGHSASLVNGIIYIVGFLEMNDDSYEILSFDPGSEAWSTLGPTAHSYWLGSSFVANGYLYAIGGYPNNSNVERYDAATDTWTTSAHMHHGRRRFGAVTIRSTGPAADMDLFDSLIAKAARTSLQI